MLPITLGALIKHYRLKNKYSVVVIDEFLYGEKSLHDVHDYSNFKIIKSNLLTFLSQDNSLDGISAVIHLADIVGDEAFAINPEFSRKRGLLSTKILADKCVEIGIKKFIFASSCSVYGQGENILDERSILSPVSLYAEDKILSEKYLLSLRAKKDFAPTILRMATLFGHSYRPRFDLVINLLVGLAIRKRQFSIFGGDQWRPFLHVKDAALIYIKILELPISKIGGEIINLGFNEFNYQLEDVGREIKKVIPNADFLLDNKVIDRRNYIVKFNKFQKLMKYRPLYDLEKGIKEMAQILTSGLIEDITAAEYSNYKSIINYARN